jgi:uncharacterized membrane protein YeiH
MLLTILDHIGVFVFAVSGLSTAAEKRLDLFGGTVIAFITALGGGTLRDLLLNTKIGWMESDTLIYVALLGALTGIVFRKQFGRWRKTFFLFDTIGISIYTIVGLQKGLNFGHFPIVAVFLGVISATFGGVIRDVLCNEIPLIFRKEFYATACMAGGFAYVGLVSWGNLDANAAFICGIALILVLRVLAVVQKWQMPLIK